MKSRLHLQDLRVMMHVGHLPEERAHKQAMRIDVSIDFHQPLKAFYTDELHDAVCYDALIKKIQYCCDHQSFKLLEYAAQCLYTLIKVDFSLDDRVLVKITKLHPPIDALKGGAMCCYGD